MNHDVWVEVDLAALRHNLRQVRSLLRPETRILAVVKANGFGHGYVEPARAFIKAGAWGLGVTRLEEALSLRSGGIDAPILVFAPILPENADTALHEGVDMTVDSLRLAQAVSDAAVRIRARARLHLKIDTGMGRLGVLPDDAIELARKAAELPGVEIAGIYTHFADAGASDLFAARKQLKVFQDVLKRARAAGVDFSIAHAANSAALLRLPESHLDMVRPGTLLYGQYPSGSVPRDLQIKSGWLLKARVCSVRVLPAGSRVGYGGEFTTRRRTTTAVLPIGFADGFTLVPEGPVYRRSVLGFALQKMRRRPFVYVRGHRAPVLGRVSMQLCTVDITDIPGVEPGEEAVVPALRIPASPIIPRVYVDTEQ